MTTILTLPNPLLRQPSVEVTDVLPLLADELKAAMVLRGGAGLAAVQIGQPVRLIVVKGVGAMYNPRILDSYAGRETALEGCLSIPGFTFEVERACCVWVEYRDAYGDVCRDDFSGDRARTIQHEVDHLDGLTILDRIATLSRQQRRALERAFGDIGAFLTPIAHEAAA